MQEKYEILLCQPKQVVIERHFDPGTTLQGVTRLETKMENVVTMCVKHFNITLVDGDMSAAQSSMLGLFSTQLSSNMGFNNFQIDTGNNITTGTALGSNMIAWTPRVSEVSTLLSTSDFEELQPVVQRFAKPIHLSEFDWRVGFVNGMLPSPLAHAYSIRAVIEFQALCNCPFKIKNPYK